MCNIANVLWFLIGIALVCGDAHFSEYSMNNNAPDFIKLGTKTHRAQHSDVSCNGKRGKRDLTAQYPWQRIPEGIEYSIDYPNVVEDENNRVADYEAEERPAWQKRFSSISPFISLGALNNLPQFFEYLKESMEKLDQQQLQQQAHMQAEVERAFRPPTTAAVLHAFRNYRPLRRTRSFPPALVQG